MRTLAITIGMTALLAAGGGAIAQGMPDSLMMSCAQARALVQSSGAIVIATGPNLYDRYVVGQNFCNREQEARPAWVRSADNPQCFIGNRCVDVDISDR